MKKKWEAAYEPSWHPGCHHQWKDGNDRVGRWKDWLRRVLGQGREWYVQRKEEKMKVSSFEMWVRAPSQEEKRDGIIYDVERIKWCWIPERKKPKQARWEPARSNWDFWCCQPKQKENSDQHYSCRSLTALSSSKYKTENTRDAKTMNLDDSQPEGKVKNLALIFVWKFPCS